MASQTSRIKNLVSFAYKISPFLLIALIVIVVWLPFGLNINPIAEMWFQRNEVESFNGISESFARQNDRIFWFWSVAFGNWITPNTFVGHQIVFVCVYIIRGVLTYVILQKLFPRHNQWALVVSLISLFNPADTNGLFWLGALHVHAHDALFLLPVYLFIQLWEKLNWWKWVILIVCLNVVLWSYEGTLLLNLAVPALLFHLEGTWRLSKYALKMTLIWYVSPIISVIIRLYMYINAVQTHFVRKLDTSIQNFEIIDGLIKAFYQMFFVWFGQIKQVIQNNSFLLFGVIIFTLSFLFLWFYHHTDRNEFEDRFNIYFSFILGIMVIVLGFLPYAFTELLRYTYDRTLIIPWIGASLIFTTLFWQFSKIEKHGFVTFGLSGLFVAFTVVFALHQHNERVKVTQIQNEILVKIIRTIPQIEEGTAISLIYEFDCNDIMGDKCQPPLFAFRFNKILTGAIQFIYNDETLNTFVHYYKIDGTYVRLFWKSNQWPLNKLIIIRYSPLRDEISVEGDFSPGLSKVPDLNYEDYAPANLYNSDVPLPYRACKIFPELLADVSSCLPTP
jgi:hypothetical protein